MKIEFVNTSRRPAWPMWAVVLVLAWLILGGITFWLSAYLGHSAHLCVFKELTGFPCPTCGLTRGTLCLLSGQPISAWLRNPFVFSLIGLFVLTTIIRLFFARGVRIQLTGPERRMAWALVSAAFLANWTYVIFYVG